VEGKQKRVDAEARKHKLDQAVVEAVVNARGRVAYQSDEMAVVVTGLPVNHLLHLVLTLITGGVWALVWIFVSVTGGEHTSTFRVDDQGTVFVESGRTRSTGTVRWPRVGGAALIVLGLGVLLINSTAIRWLGLLLAAAGLAVFVVDVRQYGTARTVSVSERL
jgi:hypothetical protein